MLPEPLWLFTSEVLYRLSYGGSPMDCRLKYRHPLKKCPPVFCGTLSPISPEGSLLGRRLHEGGGFGTILARCLSLGFDI